MTGTQRARVLCVDDEPNVLEGLGRHLRRHFELSVASSGAEGLRAMEASGPFAVVVSDMRMPQMDGAEFLRRARESWPDTVRLLLTGHADMDAAISVVNNGQIFRFLTKPCPPDILVGAIRDAAAQHELVTSERVLLEKTLHGSIRALTEVLALLSPTAFGLATRAKTRAGAIAARLGVEKAWEVEVAAMFSQMGYAIIPPETLDRIYRGQPLTEREQEMLQEAPSVTRALLENIPRLEGVTGILAYLDKNYDGTGTPRDPVKGEAIPIGARILRVVLDHDTLETQGHTLDFALQTLTGRTGRYDARVIAALQALDGITLGASRVREVHIPDLVPGMTLAEDVVTEQGALLIPRGQEVTPSLVQRLRNLAGSVRVKLPIRVLIQLEDAAGGTMTPAAAARS